MNSHIRNGGLTRPVAASKQDCRTYEKLPDLSREPPTRLFRMLRDLGHPGLPVKLIVEGELMPVVSPGSTAAALPSWRTISACHQLAAAAAATYSTTVPDAASISISSKSKPASCRISTVCCPRSGAWNRTVAGVVANFVGGFT